METGFTNREGKEDRGEKESAAADQRGGQERDGPKKRHANADREVQQTCRGRRRDCPPRKGKGKKLGETIV